MNQLWMFEKNNISVYRIIFLKCFLDNPKNTVCEFKKKPRELRNCAATSADWLQRFSVERCVFRNNN